MNGSNFINLNILKTNGFHAHFHITSWFTTFALTFQNCMLFILRLTLSNVSLVFHDQEIVIVKYMVVCFKLIQN